MIYFILLWIKLLGTVPHLDVPFSYTHTLIARNIGLEILMDKYVLKKVLSFCFSGSLRRFYFPSDGFHYFSMHL